MYFAVIDAHLVVVDQSVGGLCVGLTTLDALKVSKVQIFSVWYFLLLTASLAHMSTDCSVSYCDHSPSVGVRLSTIFLVNTLASTNINQSAPN